MSKARKKPILVGTLIRRRREELGLSQRALGQQFSPQVTTQFISNIERGVTSLPPTHVSTLSRILKISEAELMTVLEQEYSVKITDRIGIAGNEPNVEAVHKEVELIRNLVIAYRAANPETQEAFLDACGNVLGLKFDRAALGQELNRPLSLEAPISN